MNKIVSHLLKKLKNKEFIDIGANDGEYSLLAIDHGWNVIAFEKNPEIFTILKDTLRNEVVELNNIEVKNKYSLGLSSMNPSFKRNIGLIRINTTEYEIINSLKYDIVNGNIDAIILKVSMEILPVQYWLDTFIYFDLNNYKVYDLNGVESLSDLTDIDYNTICKISKTNVLIISKDIIS